MTVPTCAATITRPARARARMGTITSRAPLPLAGSFHDTHRIDAYVCDHFGKRLGKLTTAHLTSKPTWPINNAATCAVAGLIYDPDLAASLRTATLKVSTTETADVEIHLYRKGAPMGHWCITKASIDLAAQTYAFDLTDPTWYVQNRRLGYPQPRNYLDLGHWNGQDPTDGLFDSTLSGWSTLGGATMEAVESPAFDVFAPWTAKVTAGTGDPPTTGWGIVKKCDVSHSFAAGLVYRVKARNWAPTAAGQFFELVPLEVRYYPPGSTTYQPHFATKVLDNTLYPRDTWQTYTVDINVPANSGGRLEALFWAPHTGDTYWGSRWGIFRNDNFSATPYATGERPAHAIGRLIPHALKLPGDDPYRNLSSDGSSHAGTRWRGSYPDVEAHSAFDVLQQIASDGGILWKWDYTATTRSLVSGYPTVTHYDRLVTKDNPRAYTNGWDADATQARNRERMQDSTGGYSRDQIVVNAPDRPGAVIDDVQTAERQSTPVDLYQAGLDRLTWHGHTPDALTVYLPGDDLGTVDNGDLYPTHVEAEPFTLDQSRGMVTSIALDDELDRLEVTLIPRIPVEALSGS